MIAASYPASTLSTEMLLTEPTGFDLDASALQRALVRAADGHPLGDGLTDAEVSRHFGCDRSMLGLVLPVLVVVIAGVRGGKSLLAACAAVKGCLAADLSRLKLHEVPRFAIVAPTVDNAQATFRLLTGGVLASPRLSRLVVGEPTTDTLTLRRPDGRVVEIVVVAASRGAVTMRSRWLVGFVLDEVALFGSEPTGAVVNAEELLRGGETRLVPGAQGWLISSPFGPQGLLYELYRDHFGKPGRVLVVHAPTRAMNPTFPAEQIEAIRARQPDVAAREYDALWTDAETAFLQSDSIDRATRTELEIPPEEGHYYVAVIDPATRGNGWTLAIACLRTTATGLRRSIVLAREWRGSKVAPLSPKATLAEIATIVKPYGLDMIYTDQYAGDALADLAIGFGITLVIEAATQASKMEIYRSLETLLRTDAAELPPIPQVRQDLLGVRRHVGRSGVTAELARTADGRHADFAPSIATALAKATVEPVVHIAIVHGSPEWEAKAREGRRKRHLGAKDRPTWMPDNVTDRGPFASWRK